MKLRQKVVLENRGYGSTGMATSVGARVEAQFPHDRYRVRKQLDPQTPGATLCCGKPPSGCAGDFYETGIASKLCTSFEPRVRGGRTEWETDRKVAALQRYKKSMAAVGGSLRPVLFFVCIAGNTASDWATRNGMPDKAGLSILQLVLAELAHHFGLVKMPNYMAEEEKN